MQPRRYFSIRSRFADTTSVLPIAILAALAITIVIGALVDIARVAA